MVGTPMDDERRTHSDRPPDAVPFLWVPFAKVRLYSDGPILEAEIFTEVQFMNGHVPLYGDIVTYGFPPDNWQLSGIEQVSGRVTQMTAEDGQLIIELTDCTARLAGGQELASRGCGSERLGC